MIRCGVLRIASRGAGHLFASGSSTDAPRSRDPAGLHQVLALIMERPVYLDFHATTPVDPPCSRRCCRISPSIREPRQPSTCVRLESQKAADTARSQVAALIGAIPSEIVFTSGATSPTTRHQGGGHAAAIAAITSSPRRPSTSRCSTRARARARGVPRHAPRRGPPGIRRSGRASRRDHRTHGPDSSGATNE